MSRLIKDCVSHGGCDFPWHRDTIFSKKTSGLGEETFPSSWKIRQLWATRERPADAVEWFNVDQDCGLSPALAPTNEMEVSRSENTPHS